MQCLCLHVDVTVLLYPFMESPTHTEPVSVSYLPMLFVAIVDCLHELECNYKVLFRQKWILALHVFAIDSDLTEAPREIVQERLASPSNGGQDTPAEGREIASPIKLIPVAVKNSAQGAASSSAGRDRRL